MLVNQQAWRYDFELFFDRDTNFVIGEIIYNSTDPCLILGDGRCNIDDPVRKANSTNILYDYVSNILTVQNGQDYNFTIDSTCSVTKSPLESDYYECIQGCHKYKGLTFQKRYRQYDSDYYVYVNKVFFIRILYIEILTKESVTLTLKSSKTEIFTKENLSNTKYVNSCPELQANNNTINTGKGYKLDLDAIGRDIIIFGCCMLFISLIFISVGYSQLRKDKYFHNRTD
jgi:hypothetical protein